MISARDYYYLNIAKSDPIGYAAETHNSRDGSDTAREEWRPESDLEDMAKITGFKPELSNDIVLNNVMEDFICSAPRTLEVELRKAFVAKLPKKDANAGALIVDETQYDGYLIEFNVGLSDICLQYSILFTEIMMDPVLSGQGDSIRSLNEVPQHIRELARRLSEARSIWRRTGHGQLLPSLDLESHSAASSKVAVEYSTYTDAFILGHELGHHFLKHTRSSQSAQALLSRYIKHNIGLELSAREPKLHAREFQADAFATVLTAFSKPRNLSGIKLDLAFYRTMRTLGPLLTLTVLADLDLDSTKGSVTHPSPIERYDRVLSLCQSLFGDISPVENRIGLLRKLLLWQDNIKQSSMGRGTTVMMPDAPVMLEQLLKKTGRDREELRGNTLPVLTELIALYEGRISPEQVRSDSLHTRIIIQGRYYENERRIFRAIIETLAVMCGETIVLCEPSEVRASSGGLLQSIGRKFRSFFGKKRLVGRRQVMGMYQDTTRVDLLALVDLYNQRVSGSVEDLPLSREFKAHLIELGVRDINDRKLVSGFIQVMAHRIGLEVNLNEP